MLKAQDIVILLKLLSKSKKELAKLSQNRLAVELCISVSEVNAGLKRLCQSGLIIKSMSCNPKDKKNIFQYIPTKPACEKFLIYGLRYIFPAKLEEFSRGIPTAYAAPILKAHIISGDEPVPIWPYAEGNQKGVVLRPLYPSVVKSISQYPDEKFYDLLALVDALRQGKARERAISEKLLKERIHNAG